MGIFGLGVVVVVVVVEGIWGLQRTPAASVLQNNKSETVSQRLHPVPVTIMNSPSLKPTILQPLLRAVAVHVVHPDGAGGVTKPASVGDTDSSRESQLFAGNLGIILIPLVITDPSPLAIMENFDVTLRHEIN